jgi:hypothetical protein
MDSTSAIDFNTCDHGVVCVFGRVGSYVFKLGEVADGVYRSILADGFSTYGDAAAWMLLNQRDLPMDMIGIMPTHIQTAAVALVEGMKGSAPLFTSTNELEIMAAKVAADWHCLERWPVELLDDEDDE